MPASLADIAPLALLIVALAAFAASIFQTVSGFAGGILLALVLAPVIGVKALVPVMSVALLINHTSRAWVFRHAIDWPTYRAIMISGLPAIIIGAAIYNYLPAHAIALVLGLLLIGTAPLRRYLERRRFRAGRATLAVLGGSWGVLAGGTIGAGMMLVPFLLGTGVVGGQLVATLAAIAVTLNFTKTVVFGSLATLDGGMALAGVLVGLCALPGTFVGRWILERTSIQIHTLVVEVVVTLGGLLFLWNAAKGFGVVG